MGKYMSWINFNYNLTELKKNKDAMKIMDHILDNTKREQGREFLNNQVEQPMVVIREFKNSKDEMKEMKEKFGDKGLYRFYVSGLNVEPTKENMPMIMEDAKNQLKMLDKKFNVLGCYIHLNETSPGIHIIIGNYSPDKSKIGNYNKDGVNIRLSGNYYEKNGQKINFHSRELKDLKSKNKNFKYKSWGKEVMNDIWKQGEKERQKLADKYNFRFLQEPTTEKGFKRKYISMDIDKFREMDKMDIIQIGEPKTKEDQEKIKQWNYMNKVLEKAGFCKGQDLLGKVSNLWEIYIDKIEKIKPIKGENEKTR